MTTSKTLITELQKRSKGTPYLIESDDKQSFVLKLNIVDDHYFVPMYEVGVKRAFKIDARINEERHHVQTTDSLYSVDWQAGSSPTQFKPKVNWKARVQQGEVYTFERRIDVGVTKQGEVKKAIDYGFSTRDAKQWLDSQLKELGWRRVWGWSARIALAVGIIAIIGALITIISIVVLLIINPGYFK